MTYDAAAEQKKPTAAAISAGSPIRAIGVRLAYSISSANEDGVRIHPGATALHVTQLVAVSTAVAIVNPRIPPLPATYEASFGMAQVVPDVEDTLTIRPNPRDIIPAITARVVRKAVSRLRMTGAFPSEGEARKIAPVPMSVTCDGSRTG